MLWFIIHNCLKKFTRIENKKRNVITFFAGMAWYIVFYYYIISLNSIDYHQLRSYFFYIGMADILAFATYKKNIFTEDNPFLREPIEPKMTATNDFNEKATSENIPLLKNDSDYIDENEGFVKETALGNAYTTNGNSNA